MNMHTVALIHDFLGIKNESQIDPAIQSMIETLHVGRQDVSYMSETHVSCAAETGASRMTDTLVSRIADDGISNQTETLVSARIELTSSNVVVDGTRKHYSRSDVEKVWSTYIGHEQEGVCILCGLRRMLFDDRLTWEMAHVKSHSEGGTGDLSNIRPICFTCNRSMCSKHFMTFLIERYPERYHLVVNRLKLG